MTMWASVGISAARCQPSKPANAFHADDQHQRLAGALGAQFLQRQDRVGRAPTAEFAVVDEESRIVAHRGPDHLEPGRGPGERRGTVRRIPGRYESDGLEPEQFVELVRMRRCP